MFNTLNMKSGIKPFQRQCTKHNTYFVITSRWIITESKTYFGNDVLEHSLNKKEAYLSKRKQMTELSHPWKPQFVGKYTKEIDKCTSGNDIIKTLKRIEAEMDKIPDTKQYINAIRKSASLREYAICLKIFDIAKELQRVDVSIYTVMIWVCAQQRTVHALNTGLHLFVEMQEIYSLIPSISIYNQLLLLCVNTLEYNKGRRIWHDMIKEESIVPNISSYNIMMDLYTKHDEIHKAVAIFEGLLTGKYGDLKPNYVIYSTLMLAFSKHKKVDTVQKLFDKCMKHLYVSTKEHNDENKKQILILTQCLLNAYANIGNVDECVHIITNMIEKKHSTLDWKYFPNPNIQMFTSVIKALTRHTNDKNDINYESCWNIVEWCVQCMAAFNIERDAVFYGNVFHLCGDLYGNADLNVALKFYEEMKNNKIKPGELQMFNLLKTGKQYHHHKKTENTERKEFVKYILNEVEQYNIVPSVQMRKLVTKMMGTMSSH